MEKAGEGLEGRKRETARKRRADNSQNESLVVGVLLPGGIRVCGHGNISEHRLHGKLHENNQRDFRGSSWETRRPTTNLERMERVVSTVCRAKCGI